MLANKSWLTVSLLLLRNSNRNLSNYHIKIQTTISQFKHWTSLYILYIGSRKTVYDFMSCWAFDFSLLCCPSKKKKHLEKKSNISMLLCFVLMKVCRSRCSASFHLMFTFKVHELCISYNFVHNKENKLNQSCVLNLYSCDNHQSKCDA